MRLGINDWTSLNSIVPLQHVAAYIADLAWANEWDIIMLQVEGTHVALSHRA